MMKMTMHQLMAIMLSAVLLSCAGSQAFQRGERYAQRGEWDLAVKEYREANKRDPHDIEYRSALLRAEETAANDHYKKARNFMKERKLDPAIVELQQAIYLNPTNAAIQSALRSVLDRKQAEEHYRASLTFVELNRLGDAINELLQAVNLDPENVKYQDTLDKLQKKRTEIEPEEALSLASDKPISLNFKNTNIKDVFEFLAKLSGINILFDEEVKAQPVTVFVKDVSFQYALNLLLSTNKLFMKKISADTIIIIPKSKAKTDQYQDLMVKTFYINNAKSKEIVNLVRSMLDVKRVYVNETLNSITIRETPEKMKLVEKIIAANDLKEAEVILDVEILEISRTNALKYGWNFQPGLTTTASIQPTTTTATTVNANAGIALSELRNLTSDNIFVSLPSLVVNLIKQDSDAQTLANPRVRVLNNKQAKFHIGDKIPVQTSTVQSTAAVAVTSTFEYKDVGIKLTIEPTIHLNNTVTLKLGMEVSTLGDALDFGNGQKQFRFGTRNTDTLINLRDGETVIIGGLIKDEERKTRNKIPLLGDIPVLGKLFSSADDGTIKTDILMSITPNIVRNMELPDKDTQSFWSGTEENFDTKPLFVAAGKSTKPAEKPVDKTAVLESMAKREAVPAGGAAAKQPPVSAPTPTAAAAPPAEGAAVLLEMKPAEAAAQVGQESRFDIAAGGVKDLYGVIMTLSYDPKVVEFKTAGEGALLKKDGQQTSFLFSNNIKAGTVDIYMTRIGDVGGVGGSGGLCTVVFQGKSGGTSELALKTVKLTNFIREQIKTDTRGAKVVVK
jgi:general secretion pathway protein D